MIKVENINVYNLARAVYSSRNALNSWQKSDSDFEHDILGENDLNLAVRLVKAGQEHRKFMRQIFISMDITAPFYWWKQFDTYKIGTVSSSCSTMHKITSKPIEVSDFSIDDFDLEYDGETFALTECFIDVIADCEMLRKKYLETKDKRYWDGLIQLLPESYNQKRTITLNYEVLYQMYRQRKSHKLKEWHEFCEVIAALPYAWSLIVQPICDSEPSNDDKNNTITVAEVKKDQIKNITLYESKDNLVSHPDHYKGAKGIEVIDVIENFTNGLEGIEATDTGNIIKYACRWKKKGNPVQDVEKIIWYATHLLNEIKGNNEVCKN